MVPRVLLFWTVVAGMDPMTAVGQPSDPWRVWSDPLAIARYRDDHTVVVRSSFSSEPCAYDGNGQVDPAAIDCRYDHLFRPLGRHRYLYASGDEWVLVDERGAGALVRTWMTTGDGFAADFPPDLRLLVHLDGDPLPYIDWPLEQWFDGSHWPFVPPLVGNRATSAGARFALVPIAWRERLRISLAGPAASLDAARIWYQFTLQRHAPKPGTSSGIPADIGLWHGFLAQPAGSYPWPQAPSWIDDQVTVPAGATVAIADLKGDDVLLGLRLQPVDPAHWPQLALAVVVDGETRVPSLPLARLFGRGSAGDLPMQSRLVGVDAQGGGYLYLPMPHRQRLRLLLTHTGTQSADVAVRLGRLGAAAPADALPFGIQVTDGCIAGGRDAPDLPLLDVPGRGRWLGVSVEQHNAASDNANYLEGDERLYLDGARHPAWHGTGTEDFYNGGFYFDFGGYGHAHNGALAGAPWHQLAGPVPVASRMYRWLLTDAVPFHSDLSLRLERGAYGDQPLCSQALAWHYSAPLRALAPLRELDLADPASIAAAGYAAPPGATCAPLVAAYADEPPTERAGRICRFFEGASTFAFTLPRAVERLWLRRRFDGRDGGQVATIAVNGTPVGAAPYAAAHPHRRWQSVDIPLDLPAQSAGAQLAFEVTPADPEAEFTEAAYVLLASVGDVVFAHDFEPVTTTAATVTGGARRARR